MTSQVLTFGAYYADAKRTAFFLDEDDTQKQLHIVQYGLKEELDELLYDDTYPAEQTQMLWGRSIPEKAATFLRQKFIGEAGDVLYYVAAGMMLRSLDLTDAAIHLDASSTKDRSFADFDSALLGSMQPSVRDSYNPDYFGMQFWNFPPYTVNAQADPPSLEFSPDGRRVLAQLGRNLVEVSDTTSLPELYIKNSALLLAGLSSVLQNRFHSSLDHAAQTNIHKRRRRLENKTLRDGDDPERSRKSSEPRPQLDDFELTLSTLIFAALPSEKGPVIKSPELSPSDVYIQDFLL